MNVVSIIGPTCSGKTKLALQLAQLIPCEIISVDSVQIYRGMDIGTAKPSIEILNSTPHHLINIKDPSEIYSAAEFRNDALKLIAEIKERKNLPLLVGGTMLYFKALQQGLSSMPSANQVIREKLNAEARKIGWQKLYDRLAAIDPQAASRIHPNDAQRIQRALEVYELTGRPISSFYEESDYDGASFRFINLGMGSFDRKILHERIEQRFNEMLDHGFVEEVKKLFERQDLHEDLPAMRAVGYRQIWQYLAGHFAEEEMKFKAIVATRQLAKRQLTWLNSWPGLIWIDGLSAEKIKESLLSARENG